MIGEEQHTQVVDTQVWHRTQRPTTDAPAPTLEPNWVERQNEWLTGEFVPTDEDVLRLNQGRLLTEFSTVGRAHKTVSFWIADEEYPFEQAIDYHIDQTRTLTCLGITSICLERTAKWQCRLTIECQSPEHYAHLFALLDDAGFTTERTTPWAMQAYSIDFEEEVCEDVLRLIRCLDEASSCALNPVWRDLTALIKL